MVKLVKSKAGHDKNKVYVLYKEETDYVLLVDGEKRTIDAPKRKNKKHIQLISHLPKEVYNIWKEDDIQEQERIRRLLKQYCKTVENDNATNK